jgi:hypothetical protein
MHTILYGNKTQNFGDYSPKMAGLPKVLLMYKIVISNLKKQQFFLDRNSVNLTLTVTNKKTDRQQDNFGESVWLLLRKMQKSNTVFLFFILVCGTFAFCQNAQRPYTIDNFVLKKVSLAIF